LDKKWLGISYYVAHVGSVVVSYYTLWQGEVIVPPLLTTSASLCLQLPMLKSQPEVVVAVKQKEF
jgi:hypothetical protein